MLRGHFQHGVFVFSYFVPLFNVEGRVTGVWDLSFLLCSSHELFTLMRLRAATVNLELLHECLQYVILKGRSVVWLLC